MIPSVSQGRCNMVYDVIIAGGSFAGLAVATQLRGRRVLILDRKPVGTGQTSACGTIMPVLEHWHAEESVLQVHHSLFLHTAGRDIEFKPPTPGAPSTTPDEACGRTVGRVLDGVLTLAQGLKEYAAFVRTHALFYRLMSGTQWLLTRLPPGWIIPLALAISLDKLRQAVMNAYWHIIRPATPDA